MKKQIVLPADVYDALELSAEAFGGIGGGSRNIYEPQVGSVPHCVIGHANFLDGEETNPLASFRYENPGPVNAALREAFGVRNGWGVAHKNDDITPVSGARIPFAQWCKKLNVIRGN